MRSSSGLLGGAYAVFVQSRLRYREAVFSTVPHTPLYAEHLERSPCARRSLVKQFANRTAAGRELASLLGKYINQPDVLVLGLPRGGVPVAFEVAQTIHAPLDVMIVRKIGAPGQPEVAIGAIAPGGVTVMNEEMLAWFRDSEEIERTAAAELIELQRREKVYRGTRPPLTLKERIVILVDDGAATGASMLAAVRAAHKLDPKMVIVALPVAASSACELLSKEVDELFCLTTPLSFCAVGQWYAQFDQTSDREVIELLARAEQTAAAP
jgi:putative phosphoribosyl transferase